MGITWEIGVQRDIPGKRDIASAAKCLVLIKSKKPLGPNRERSNFAQFGWNGSEITILDIGCKHGCNQEDDVKDQSHVGFVQSLKLNSPLLAGEKRKSCLPELIVGEIPFLGVAGVQFNPSAVNKFFENLNCITDIDKMYNINIKKNPFGQPDEFV